MLKNYLKIAWRNMIRHRMHTVINVIGLALGLTCCLFIFLWVQDERSFDNFHRKGDRLFSVFETIRSNGRVNGNYNTPTKYTNGKQNFFLADVAAAVPDVKRVAFYAKGYELPWGHPESFQVGDKIITQSLREAITPVLIDVKEGLDFGVILARTRAGQTKEALASLEKVYKAINPGYAFSYQFVDEEYKKLYTSELIISKLSVLFAVLAILISCLGLLGLVMFAAEQRIKEIGIRKVLGASLVQIIRLFSRDFLQLIFLAFLIAAPLAWLSMDHWLQNFAYRIDLSWWIFALAGAAAILVALLTVCYQAVKSARANPVQSLRAN